MTRAYLSRLILFLWAVFIFHVYVDAAYAQTAPAAAPLLIDRNRLDRQAQPPSAETSTPTVAPPSTVNASLAAVTPFTLTAVQVQGAKSLDPASLAGTYSDRIGKTATIADIGAITDRIGALYVAAGFPLYSVIVPKQSFDGGVLVVRATEGYVDNVVIDGDTEGADLSLLRIYAAKIVADRPLHHAILARYLLLMNDIPGLKVGSRFDPAPGTAGVTLHLIIQRKHFDFGLAFDNEGSRFISRLEFTATATANSIFQEGDRTELIYGFPADYRDYHYYGLTHLEPLGTEGATVQFSTSLLETHPMSVTSISGEAYTAGLRFTVPVIRQQDEDLSLIASLDALDSSNGFLGQTLSNERTRAIRMGVAYATGPLDGSRVTMASAVLSQGIDALGARPGARGTGGPTFTKLNLRVEHDRTIGPKFILRLKAAAQASPDSVPASEEFTYGGNDLGRAFGVAEAVGDRGVAAGAELAYRLPTAWTGLSYLSNAEAYTYYDLGQLWFVSPLLRTPSLGQSAGLGVRVRVYDKLTLAVEAGFPIECPSQIFSCSAGRGVFNLVSKF